MKMVNYIKKILKIIVIAVLYFLDKNREKIIMQTVETEINQIN